MVRTDLVLVSLCLLSLFIRHVDLRGLDERSGQAHAGSAFQASPSTSQPRGQHWHLVAYRTIVFVSNRVQVGRTDLVHFRPFVLVQTSPPDTRAQLCQ